METSVSLLERLVFDRFAAMLLEFPRGKFSQAQP
jgi:hypothetical protein